MMDIHQIREKTGLKEDEIYQIVGSKPTFSEWDLETVLKVIDVKQSHNFNSVREALAFIKGKPIKDFEDTSGPNSTLALLSAALQQTLEGYFNQASDLADVHSKLISQFTDQVASHMYHRAAMIPSEILQKYVHLVRKHPPTQFSNFLLTKEEVQRSLWELHFRKVLPELPKASNEVFTDYLPQQKSEKRK